MVLLDSLFASTSFLVLWPAMPLSFSQYTAGYFFLCVAIARHAASIYISFLASASGCYYCCIYISCIHLCIYLSSKYPYIPLLFSLSHTQILYNLLHLSDMACNYISRPLCLNQFHIRNQVSSLIFICIGPLETIWTAKAHLGPISAFIF